MQGQYIEINGIDLYYEQSGNGDNLILIHTAGTDGRIWMDAAARLSSRFRVFNIDLPGHGKSIPWRNWRRNRPTVEFYAATITEFLNKLSLDKVSVLGCSIGADVALALAAGNDKRIERVYAMEGAAKTDTFKESEILSTDPYDLARTFNFCGPMALKQNMEKLYWNRTSNNRDIYIGDLLAWNNFDMREKLKEANIPVILLRGIDDPVVSEEMVRETVKLNRKFKMHQIEGLGHYPMIENP